jgi:hypothetical protein
MWRAFASLLFTFLALAWAVVATAVCFFYSAALWRDLFGHEGAFYGAVAAFALCILGARFLLRIADRLIEPFNGPFDERAYRDAPRDTFYANWQRYSADIVRDRRYAYYVRTRQWDKLVGLGPAVASGSAGADLPADLPADLATGGSPRSRISAAADLSPAEVSRAARRVSHKAERIERWAVYDEYE